MIELQALHRILDRRLSGIWARLEANVRRCVIKLIDDDAGVRKVQAQIDSDETTYDDTPHLQPYGLSTLPPAEAEAVRFQFGSAAEDEFIAFAHVRSERPRTLTDPGTGGLYFLGEFKVFVDASGVLHLGGGMSAGDFVALAQKVDDAIAAMVDYINNHTHPAPGGATDKPLPPLAGQASVAASNVKAT